jgi:hypothetical protein
MRWRPGPRLFVAEHRTRVARRCQYGVWQVAGADARLRLAASAAAMVVAGYCAIWSGSSRSNSRLTTA